MNDVLVDSEVTMEAEKHNEESEQKLFLNSCCWIALEQDTNPPTALIANNPTLWLSWACVHLVLWCMCLQSVCYPTCKSPVENFAAVWPTCHWSQTQTSSIVVGVFCLRFAPRCVAQTQSVVVGGWLVTCEVSKTKTTTWLRHSCASLGVPREKMHLLMRVWTQ